MFPADQGFGLIEQIIAMTVIVGALLGLLSTLGATAQGVTTSRQRTIGVSLAKQTIENLQGAAYSNVAISLTGLAADPLVHGTAPNLTFESEPIVLGGTTPYRTTLTTVGTTFALRTFVTAVAAGYRRVTVIVEWPAVTPRHTMRFASLVFPLDYASYPASGGEAEATGGLITVSGTLGGDTFEDAHMLLPGVRVDTNSSTLRTSIAAAASATSYVDLLAGPIASTTCSGTGGDVGECPHQTLESVADNDSTSRAGNWTAGVGQTFVAASLATPGGTTVNTPAGTMTSRASTDGCGVCGFGDNDGLPWADSSVNTTSGSSADFRSDHGVGKLEGSLWALADAWSPSASIDHDPTGNGIVTASAQLVAPALRVFDLEQAPDGFDGAVKVSSFSAKASATSGYTMVAPDLTAGTTAMQLQLWDGAGYRLVNITPGAALDTTATATFTVGDHIVTFNSHVRAQPSTFSTAGSGPRTDGAAQHPSILIITVDVVITSTTQFDPPPETTSTTSTSTTTTTPATTTTTTTSPESTTSTSPESTSSTTTSTTTPATTTTIPLVPTVTDRFTISVDYGRVSAHDTWLAKAP